MQNAGIAALGLNWRYLAFDVNPKTLREAIGGAMAMKFIGLNLTVPHKLLAMELVDELDESAKAWGAVNTVRFEARKGKGPWLPLAQLDAGPVTELRSRGFNTDADAITRSLREDLGFEPRGARILLLGAGGAGRVAALKLAADGARELFLVNRTVSKAHAVATELRRRFQKTKAVVGYPKGAVDLVLNATSLGLKAQDATPLDERQFPLRQARAVYDMVYRPAETALLKAAKSAGCRTANGLGMLLYQGAKALEIWSGKASPIKVMRRALEQHIYG